MISIQNVTHHINQTPILQNIDLSIKPAGITALIGPNGAGKSTLLNLISRLLPLQTGSISVDGHDINTTPSHMMALKLANVTQQLGVASRIRVRELVNFGRWPHHRGRPNEKDHHHVNEALELFELSDLANRYLDQLSGGQVQRAFVAMGFAQDTDWLLLDEPLNNLDMYHARRLMQTIHRLSRPDSARPRSVVMVIHEINYAAAWADHIIVLKEGQIVHTGTPSEVFTPGHINDIFDMEVQVDTTRERPLILHHL